ncbi:MAG: cytochrome c [Burkholderiaceae bacterium]|nr:cytochrome c [Rhodoferax sp.]
MKVLASFVLAASAFTLAAPAQAQFAKPEDAIKYRKAALTVMAAHFGRVAAMANGRMPFDAGAAASNAATAEMMSKLPWAAFGDGTDKGDTKAKPEIWSDKAKFMAASEKMQGEMTKLAAVAKGGNIDAIKAQVGATGGACKACHDDFRKE